MHLNTHVLPNVLMKFKSLHHGVIIPTWWALRKWMHKEGRIFMDENKDIMKWEPTRPGIGRNGSNSHSNIIKILEKTSLVPLVFISPLLTYEDIVVSSASAQEALGRRHLGCTIKYKSVFILRILNLRKLCNNKFMLLIKYPVQSILL